MKIIYLCAAVAGLCLLLVGCTKSFLDVKPLSQGTIANYYKTPDDINGALIAAYDILQSGSFFNGLWTGGELTSDNTTAGTTAVADIRQFDNFALASANTILSPFWGNSYRGVAFSNLILNRIKSVAFSDTNLRNQFIGEAKFLRAFHYFNLVRSFGDVPLVTREFTTLESLDSLKFFTREPVAKVYAQIALDLRDAGRLLPATQTATTQGKPTRWSALGLLGKAYLQNKQADLALPVLKEVVDKSGKTLLANYADVFSPNQKNNAESLFEIQFLSGGSGNGGNFPDVFLPAGSGVHLVGPQSSGGADGGLPTTDIVNSFTASDARRDVSLATQYTRNDGRVVQARYIKKYLAPVGGRNDGNDNFPILRFADVLLLYAEAINEVNKAPNSEAYRVVNLVRTRAKLPNLPTTLTYQSFRDALLLERRLELAFENQRFFDLVRFEKATEVLSKHLSTSAVPFVLKPCQLVFPIPQSETELNPNMKQNDYSCR